MEVMGCPQKSEDLKYLPMTVVAVSIFRAVHEGCTAAFVLP
jgi:hypothetical protein